MKSEGSGMTREEHLQWCKDRAMEYVSAGDMRMALTSMASDLGKHPETEGHPGVHLGFLLLVNGGLSTPDKMRAFIMGFN